MCRLKFKRKSSNYTKLKITQKGDIYYLRGSYRKKAEKIQRWEYCLFCIVSG